VSTPSQSFHAVVVGASGGIGSALTRRLLVDPRVTRVTALSRSALEASGAKPHWRQVDITDERSIAKAVAGLDEVHLAFVATGTLHENGELQPEKSWRSLDAAKLSRAYEVNAIGPALVAKHVLPLFPLEGRAAFAALSARVGSISDNRLGGWHAYRASKAALNQLIRTLSIELATRRKDALCVALHPGTVNTKLSKPFQGGVAPDKLFTPDYAAERLLAVLDGLTPADTGGFFAWNGERIPF